MSLLTRTRPRRSIDLPATFARFGSANFHQARPANYDAEFWPENAINGRHYGFP